MFFDPEKMNVDGSPSVLFARAMNKQGMTCGRSFPVDGSMDIFTPIVGALPKLRLHCAAGSLEDRRKYLQNTIYGEVSALNQQKLITVPIVLAATANAILCAPQISSSLYTVLNGPTVQKSAELVSGAEAACLSIVNQTIGERAGENLTPAKLDTGVSFTVPGHVLTKQYQECLPNKTQEAFSNHHLNNQLTGGSLLFISAAGLVVAFSLATELKKAIASVWQTKEQIAINDGDLELVEREMDRRASSPSVNLE